MSIIGMNKCNSEQVNGGTMKFRIVLLIALVSIFISCEYTEDTSDDDGGTEFRLASINVTGDITGVNSEVYTYNEQGYITSITRRDTEGNSISFTSFQYEEGKVTNEMTIVGNTAIRTEYEYQNGYKVKSTSYDQNNIITEVVDYYYDLDGFLIKKEVKEASGALIGEVTFSYENNSVKGYGKELTEYTLLSQ
jgi:YD repeat-containing protein